MKKFLLILGFLPVIAFADVSPKEALTQQTTEIINYSYLTTFTQDYYERELRFYQRIYDLSDKNTLCQQTIESFKKNLEAQRQFNFEVLKNDIVKPAVATLDDQQVKQLLIEFKTGNLHNASENHKKLAKLIDTKVKQYGMEEGKVYTMDDLLDNCPVKTQ